MADTRQLTVKMAIQASDYRKQLKAINTQNKLLKSEFDSLSKSSDNFEIIQDMSSNVSNLSNDFSIMRETLLSNIKSSKIILSSFGDEIVANGSDTNPKLLSAYSELLESCNNSIKLLGGIYKDISETHLKIKKLLATEQNSIDETQPRSETKNTIIFANTSELLKEISSK